ncbi:hypothetical protein E4U41_005627 [Claviceps citrina]|nr:hypothetical protein E4U41_005627 [Claviceps citrina]
MSSNKNNKERFYAVAEGRVDEPTIFGSWGDAHPRVTGCPSDFKAFPKVEEAREFMERKGATNPKEVIKKDGGSAAPSRDDSRFYAVAHGRIPGIYENYSSGNKNNGAEAQVHGVPGACHQRFETKEQAQSFIDDWNKSSMEVHRREQEALEKGFGPPEAERQGRFARDVAYEETEDDSYYMK